MRLTHADEEKPRSQKFIGVLNGTLQQLCIHVPSSPSKQPKSVSFSKFGRGAVMVMSCEAWRRREERKRACVCVCVICFVCFKCSVGYGLQKVQCGMYVVCGVCVVVGWDVVCTVCVVTGMVGYNTYLTCETF